MKHMDRRMTLGVLATGFASSQVSVRSAFGAKLAQAGAPPSPVLKSSSPHRWSAELMRQATRMGMRQLSLKLAFPKMYCWRCFRSLSNG